MFLYVYIVFICKKIVNINIENKVNIDNIINKTYNTEYIIQILHIFFDGL